MLAFKSRVLASQPAKALLDEMKAHRKGMMMMLAAVTIIWCQHGSIAMRLQDELKMNLRKSIDDIDNFKHTLTNTTATGATMIRAQRPGEDCSHEHIAYIDVNNRQGLYPLSGRMQLAFIAKLVPSTCSGQSGPLYSKEKQLQPPVTER